MTTVVATVAEAHGWLGLDGLSALDTFLKAHGIGTEGMEGPRWRLT